MKFLQLWKKVKQTIISLSDELDINWQVKTFSCILYWISKSKKSNGSLIKSISLLVFSRLNLKFTISTLFCESINPIKYK